MRSSHSGRGFTGQGRHIRVAPGQVGPRSVPTAPLPSLRGVPVGEGQREAIPDRRSPYPQPVAAVQLPAQRGSEVGGEHEHQGPRDVAQLGQDVIVRRSPVFAMRHGELGGPGFRGEPPHGGHVAPPCVYLRGMEHLGGVGQKAGGVGRPDEPGHIPTPPHVGTPGRPQPFRGRRVPRVIGARPGNHGGPWPGVRPSLLERDDGVLRRGGPCLARGGAPPAPFARPLCAHYVGLPRDSGATSDDPWREEGALQVLRETPWQVLVWAGVLLRWTLQGAIHDAEGGHEVPASARQRGGGQSPPAAVSHWCTGAAALRGARRSWSSWCLRSSHTEPPSRSMCWRSSSTVVPPGGS